MLRVSLAVVALLALPSVGVAADPQPTAAELKDIKQLSEDIFGLPKRKQACEKLGEYGPKARAAIPNLTELLTDGKEKEPEVLAAAALALGRIGGPDVAKRLKDIAAKQADPQVKTGCQAALLFAGDKSPETIRAALDAASGGILLKDEGEWKPTPVAAYAVSNLDTVGLFQDLSVRYELVHRVLEIDARSQTVETRAEIESLKCAVEGHLATHVRAVMRPVGGVDRSGKILNLFVPGAYTEADALKDHAKAVQEQEKRLRELPAAYSSILERAGAEGKTLAVRAFVGAVSAEAADDKFAQDVKWQTAKLSIVADPLERAVAAAKLGLLKNGGAAALPELKKLLKDKSPLVATVAADAIAKIEKK